MIVLKDSKEISISITSILNPVDFIKKQKPRDFEKEIFVLQTKIFVTYIARATSWQKFVAEVTFRALPDGKIIGYFENLISKDIL